MPIFGAGDKSATDGIVMDVVDFLIEFWAVDDISVVATAGLPESVFSAGGFDFSEDGGVEFFPSGDDFFGEVSFEVPCDI